MAKTIESKLIRTFPAISICLLLVLGNPNAQAEEVELVSRSVVPSLSALGQSLFQPNDNSQRVISGDGRYVVFRSQANNIVPNDTNDDYDVFRYDRINDVVELVSGNLAGTATGNGFSTDPSISADGSRVAFFSDADDLVMGDGNDTSDVFVHDFSTGQTQLVSVNLAGTGSGDLNSFGALISDNGQAVCFSSFATDLVPVDSNNSSDIFVRDLANSTTELVSYNVSGIDSSNGFSRSPSISSDGTIIAFSSNATDLTAISDTNNRLDVFVRNTQTGTTSMLSVNVSGVAGNNTSDNPEVSADGSKIVFTSSANDLVSNDSNGSFNDVFVFDLTTSALTLVSVNASGTASGNHRSDEPVINSDGSMVAFESFASDMVSGDNNGWTDVFVRNLNTGVTTLVSVNTTSGSGSNRSTNPAISADGTKVGFRSYASDLVANLPNTGDNVFLRDLNTNQTQLVSVNLDGLPSIYGVQEMKMSEDGDTLTFYTGSGDLVAGDLDEFFDVFTRNMNEPSVRLASRADASLTNSASAAGTSAMSSVSADGRYVVFETAAANLFVNDANFTTDVFRFDRQTGQLDLVSVNMDGTASGNGRSSGAVISGDGMSVVFDSEADDLVDNDFNGTRDVFVRNFANSTTTMVSVNQAGTGGGNSSSNSYQAISHDGSVIAFQSNASDLVANDLNGAPDIFARNMNTNETVAVSAIPDGTNTGEFGSIEPVISGNGEVVLFFSYANDLVANDSNGFNQDLFARNLTNNSTTLISRNFSGTNGGNSNTLRATVDFSGQRIVFGSRASDLVENDNNSRDDVFLFDFGDGTTRLVSARYDGAGSSDNHSYEGKISQDGSTVIFESRASDLVDFLLPANVNQIFAYSVDTTQLSLVTVDQDGEPVFDGSSYRPSVNATGTLVSFISNASSLTMQDFNVAPPSVFLRDMVNETTTLASPNYQMDGIANGQAQAAFLNSDGSVVIFESDATDLIERDFNFSRDVFAFPVASGPLLGDVNLDGEVNLLDVDFFIERVATNTFQEEADCNGDGIVNLLDIDPFIAILGG